MATSEIAGLRASIIHTTFFSPDAVGRDILMLAASAVATNFGILDGSPEADG